MFDSIFSRALFTSIISVSVGLLAVVLLPSEILSYLSKLGLSNLVLFLLISFVVQNVFCKVFSFPQEIKKYSELLALHPISRVLHSRFGSLITSYTLISTKFLASFILLLTLTLFAGSDLQFPRIIFLTFIGGYLLEPLFSLCIKSTVSDEISFRIFFEILGYLAVLLLVIGIIPIEDLDNPLYRYSLVFSLIHFRMTFLTTFAFQEKDGLLIFGPIIFCIFITVLPNLKIAFEHL